LSAKHHEADASPQEETCVQHPEISSAEATEDILFQID
jgi:hypothetical protein